MSDAGAFSFKPADYANRVTVCVIRLLTTEVRLFKNNVPRLPRFLKTHDDLGVGQFVGEDHRVSGERDVAAGVVESLFRTADQGRSPIWRVATTIGGYYFG